jgi:hypothetical protein
MATKAEVAAAKAAESKRVQALANAQAQAAVAKEVLSTAQSGARTTTGQTIFEKALAGLPSSYNQNTDVARGMAAMSARYGLQAADLNAYAGENIGYNIAEQTKAEQASLDVANSLVSQYSIPVQIPALDPAKSITYSMISELLKKYNIEGLAAVLDQIRSEYPEASTDDVLFLLQFDSRYNAKFNERFKANAQREAAGLTVLKPDTYFAMEQGYKKVFNQYGLVDFNNQDYYDSLISADLAVTEVTDRVNMAFDRVLNDTAVSDAFTKFYPSVTKAKIVTAILDPKKQGPAVERQVKAAEIGGAALRQNLMTSEFAATETQANVPFTNVTRGTVGADVLGQQGVTKAQAEAQYKSIAEFLPTAEKLSSIYGGTAEQYGLLQAEQEKLQGLASAARKRENIRALEIAQFGKRSGLGKGALGSTTNI